MSRPAFRRTSFTSMIRDARRTDGRKLREIAEQIGISEAQMCRLEGGQRKPTENVARRLAEAYGLDPDLLMAVAGFLSAEVTRFMQFHPAAAELMRSLVTYEMTGTEIDSLIGSVKIMQRERVQQRAQA